MASSVYNEWKWKNKKTIERKLKKSVPRILCSLNVKIYYAHNKKREKKIYAKGSKSFHLTMVQIAWLLFIKKKQKKETWYNISYRDPLISWTPQFRKMHKWSRKFLFVTILLCNVLHFFFLMLRFLGQHFSTSLRVENYKHCKQDGKFFYVL